MESREEKIKAYREEIASQVKEEAPKEEKEVVVETTDKPVIKNTLTMTMDEIIEAHDEYTMIIEQKELKDKIKLEKKAKSKAMWKKIGKYSIFALVVLALIFLLVVVLVRVL